ncbi:MAG: hypothetical protein NC089_03125 [Bacteroides sp.]|nr:hypothetical protein [Bacteroides sp.]MCM1549514.1 hypothetical protein [Clostridium sp.]
MGKRINFWMEYESFLLIAQRAIDIGCTIVREDAASGRVIEWNDTSIVTRDQCDGYYFHLLEAGPIEIERIPEGKRLRRYNCDSGNVVIEAGYSPIINSGGRKIIRRGHIGCETGYYDETGRFMARPECLTRAYNILLRYVRKLAPYTELTDKSIDFGDKDGEKKSEYVHREYVTKTCLDLRDKEGYKLAQI